MVTTPIPQGHTAVSPYLIVRDASRAIEFYKKAFGARECKRMESGGKVMHAEIQISDGHIMLADEFPEQGFKSPQTLGGSPAFIHLYVENAHAVFKRAVEAGAEVIQEVTDQFFGDRHGLLKDPFGYTWTIATHVEDVSEDELKRRIAEYAAQTSRS